MYNRNTRWILALAVAAALAALPGCGGGGGGGGGGGQQQNFPPPSTTLRTLTAGDTWVYSVAGTATSPGQKTSTLSGTITRTVNAASAGNPFPANMFIREVDNIPVSGGGFAGTIVGTTDTYYTQDAATGSVYEVGQVFTPSIGAPTTSTVNNPSLATSTIIPGAWAQGDDVDASFTDAPSGGLTQTFDIGTAGGANVAGSSYSGWNVTVVDNGGTPSPEIWDPTLGSYLTNTFTETTTDSSNRVWTLTVTAKLSSTKFG